MTIAALSYHAHDGCPSAMVFVEQVRARTSNVEFGDARGNPGVQIGVEITRAQDRSVGKLTIVSPDATRTERELSSVTCSELVRALALSTALNLDPSLTETPDQVAQPSPLPQAPPGPRGAAESVPESPSPAQRPGVPAIDPERPRATSLGAGLGADVFFVEAIAPSLTLYLDHVYAGRTQPSWRIGLHGSRAVVSNVAQGSIDLYWITTRLSGSPIRLHWGSVDLVPVATAEAGVLAGHGRPTVLPSKNAWTSWFALGLGGRFEVSLTPKWVVELEADAVFPLFGREAGFDGQPAIFQTPSVGVSGGAGARYVFR